MSMYCFGVDLGGTSVKLGLFDDEKKLCEKWEIATRMEDCGSHILDDIAGAVKAKMNEKGLSKSDVSGIGMGVPGAVTSDGVINKCVNLGWGVFNVEKALSEKTGGIPVKAANDANAAALGEYEAGAGKQYDSMVFITIGTGVGGGIIVNGRILTGQNGAAAEIGHLFVVSDAKENCNCGKRGCLEQVASATGIVKQAVKLLNESSEQSVLRNMSGISAKDVFDAAKAGDKLALQVAENTGYYLGVALSHAGCMLDPECFIIGGGVSNAGEFLLEKIRKNYRENVFHASRNAKIERAVLGNDAGIYGAAYLI